MILYLARHGQTQWWEGNRFCGWSDIGLTDLGSAQAEKLGDWAQHVELSRVLASDLSRSWLTATPAAEASGLPVEQDPRFREMNFGAAEGMTEAGLAERYPLEERAFRANPLECGLPNGETGKQVIERFAEALSELVNAAAESDRVLLVAHGTAIRLIVALLLGIDPNDYRRRLANPGNVALSSFEIGANLESVRLISYNQII